MSYLVNSGGKLLLVGTVDADTLDATFGFDSMLVGQAGNDLYIVDSVNDIVVEDAGGGADTVRSSASYALTPNVENLVLTGGGNIDGTGNELNNTLTGNDGDNVLDGGLGNDTMAGGLGSDTYIVDSTLDVVSEGLNAGYDTVHAAVNFTLGLNLEALVLDGNGNINGAGNALDNQISGNTGNNVLTGGAGNDTISGDAGNDVIDGGDNNDQLSGGDGNDTLIGGAGNDHLDGGDGSDTFVGGMGDDYYVVGAGDKPIAEAPASGDDTVDSDVNWTLEANVENLILHSGAGTLIGTGNAGNNHLLGNESPNMLFGLAGNDTLDGGIGLDTMYGGQGNDTYVVDDSGDKVVELPGALEGTADKVVTLLGFYRLGANVENLRLTGVGDPVGYGNELNNVLVGNAGNNFLLAFGGNDILDGGPGADNLQGGPGDDVYYFDNPGDYVMELFNSGTDLIISSVMVDLRYMYNVENATLTGSSSFDLFGNGLKNVLTGNAGDNFIDAGAGFDIMAGGLGNDTYIVGSFLAGNPSVSDTVVEGLNAGYDTVISYVTYVLPANVEKLVLGNTAGSINGTGNGLDNVIQGNPGTNTIDGGAGNDTLSGFGGDDTLIGGDGNDSLDGGSGQDTMQGGMGNDVYSVDNLLDTVTENPAAGIDTVRSTITFDLGVSAPNVENLTLLGSDNINGTGTGSANVITGNDGDNTLTGNDGNDTLLGGDGNDTLDGGTGDDFLDGGGGADGMTGGAGNDTYVVDNPGDTVTEAAGGGIDTIRSSISFDLGANGANVENLTLVGSTNIDATGNALNNVITGNDGNNVLDGGAGADTLRGGKGNDTYKLDSAADVVVENAGEGLDEVDVNFVPAGNTYTLGANLEALFLNGVAGNEPLKGVGNALDNLIEGNNGNNTLDGGAGNDVLRGHGGADKLIGGDGNDLMDGGATDTMTGGAGNDVYVVDSANVTIVELPGQGTDDLHTTVDFDMSAAAPNVENLYLDDNYDDSNGFIFQSPNNLNAVGNALDNKIFASAGDDTVQGGGGNDTFYFTPYDLDVLQWAAVLGNGPSLHFQGIKIDSADAVWGGTSSADGGSNDSLFGDVVDLNGQLHIHGVENITLYSAATGGGSNTVNASDITGANNITLSDLRAADVADFPGAAAADLSLTNLAAGVAVAATNFHDDLSISLANATGNADKLDVTVNGFSGALTTTDIETVHLNLVEPADGSATGVDMSAATGVDHLGISAPSGVLTLLMPGDATLDLENCNLYIHLLDNALTSLDVTLDNTGVTLQTDSAGFVLNLDTGGSGAGPDGPSFVSTRPSGAATINVKGSQALDMGVQDQDVDAHTMTGDLHVWAGESTAAVSLIGGQGNDYLQGGSGDDRLNGGGVGSADLLFGNAGADTFVFDHQPTDGNNTYLPDFLSGEDKIELKQSVFGGLATEVDGTLAAGAFFKGDPGDPAAVAGAAGAHILFEPNSGNLYYDGDATAGGEQLFANVWYNNNVEHGDIHVVA